MSNHVLRSGHKLSLGRKLGEGGEGAVYEISGRPNFVAKIYSKPLDPKHAEKLEVVCALRTDKLSEVCAWPIEAIYKNGKACGFVMPLVIKATEIHELFGSAGRKRLFPHADWAFLIHVARNLAAAVHKLHISNIVVGDFNQRNIVVSGDATVKMWDCDSFQVERNGRTFYCTVGVPEFTAPELQSCTSFDGVKRSSQHDRFSLAVMIFYLLFLGRHPFSGDPTDPRVNSFELQEAIASCKFAYSPNASKLGVRPPRISPPVRDLGDDLMPLFVQAFETSNRPSAADWFTALKKLESDLSRCSFNPGHVFPRRLNACPWCLYEAQWAITTFLPTACPPRFVKQFDYAGLVASVKYCFQDLAIVIPPEPSGFKGRPLPPLFAVPPGLAGEFDLAKNRLAQWSAEIVKLNELRQPDCKVAEIIKQGQAFLRERKAVKQRVEGIQANATKSQEKCGILQAKISQLNQRSTRKAIPWSAASSIIVGVIVFTVSMSPVVGLISALGIFASAHFVERFYKSFRLKSLNQSLLHSTSKGRQFEVELNQLTTHGIALESRLNELANVLKELRKTDDERIKKVDLLLANAELSRQSANNEFLAKQSAFFEAQASHNRAMHQRKQEYGRRVSAMRQLEAQRSQIATRLNGMSCPDSLRNCRRQFTEAKNEYDRVQSLFLNELDLIKRSSRDRQLTEFLEKFSIEKAKPGRLSSSLIVNLKSHGIETAADVTRKAVLQVWGFGEKRTAILVAWRGQLETMFVFDATRPLSQQDQDSARLKFSNDFHKAETALQRATEQLRLAYESAKMQVVTSERELAVVNENLGQARADVMENP